MKLSLKVMILIFSVCGSSLGQTASQSQRATFHIEGTITSPWDSSFSGTLVPRKRIIFGGEHPIKTVTADEKDIYVEVPRTEVKFSGEYATKTLIVDDRGFYQANLPIGLYKMTVKTPTIGSQSLTPYARLFLVKSPGTIFLNGALYMATMTCDIVVGGTPEQQIEESKDACGGEDRFTIPSKDGTPFELYIRFSNRSRWDQGSAYGGDRFTGRVPVLVAYNLFSLEAGGVTYDSRNHTITASGHVKVEESSGEKQYFDSIAFKLEDGQAIPLKASSLGQ